MHVGHVRLRSAGQQADDDVQHASASRVVKRGVAWGRRWINRITPRFGDGNVKQRITQLRGGWVENWFPPPGDGNIN